MIPNYQVVTNNGYNATDESLRQGIGLGGPFSGFGFFPGYIGRPGIALGGLGTGFGLFPGFGFGAPGFGLGFPYPPFYPPYYPPYPIPYR